MSQTWITLVSNEQIVEATREMPGEVVAQNHLLHPEEEATAFWARVRFHYTPKHASWLHMAEIEIGILDRQRTERRIGKLKTSLRSELLAWEQERRRGRCRPFLTLRG